MRIQHALHHLRHVLHEHVERLGLGVVVGSRLRRHHCLGGVAEVRERPAIQPQALHDGAVVAVLDLRQRFIELFIEVQAELFLRLHSRRHVRFEGKTAQLAHFFLQLEHEGLRVCVLLGCRCRRLGRTRFDGVSEENNRQAWNDPARLHLDFLCAHKPQRA
jgi:hypothetical protein